MKVLVGVDGSSNSFAAVEFVGRLLAADRDELVLLFAVPEISFDDERLDPAIAERARAALSRTVLDSALERLPGAWRGRADTRNAAGPATTLLLETIDQVGADVVAVGFRGTGGIIERFMLGSVSRAIVHSAKVPVLVVESEPAGEAPAKQSPGPAVSQLHVLLAHDDAAVTERAAALLKQITWPPETRGWAMTVVRPMFITDLPDWIKLERDPDVAAMAAAWELENQQNLQAARSELEKLRQTLPPCFTSEQLVVAEGRPAEEILAQVREKAIDLVVMGSCGSSSLQRLLLGSTTEQVLREAPCSVLIVR
jgi:nucleotide-binding universal stress UspA family protein